MADVAVGANTGATPQGAPAPIEQRAKIGDMARTLAHGTPAAPLQQAPEPQRQRDPQQPQQRRQQQVAERPLLGFDESGNPDLGFAGDLDAEANALALREPDGLGAELDEYGMEPQDGLELDDSVQGELVDPSDYERIKALMDADDIPAEWEDKKWTTVELKARDGSTYNERMTLADCKRGYMRREDYSTKLNEVTQLRNQVIAVQQGQNRMIADLNGNPASFIQAMRILGVMHMFEQTAEAWAKEVALPEQNLKQTNPAAYQQYLQNKALQERLAAAERQAQQALTQAQQLQQQQPQQVTQEVQQIANQLAQMLPIAEKSVQIDAMKARSPTFKLVWDEPVAQGKTRGEQIFEMHFARLLPTLQGPLTTQFVREVLMTTVDTVRTLASELAPRGRAPVAAAPPPNAGGAQANGRRVETRAKIGDMRQLLRR